MRLTPPLLLVTAALLIGAGCSSKTTTRIPEQGDTTNGNVAQQPANTKQSVTITTPNAMPVFTLDEVETHAVLRDCWIVIHEKVYDVSSFIPKYPDKKTITDQCGKNATTIFDQLTATPDEKTANALKLLPQYEIGTLTQ